MDFISSKTEQLERGKYKYLVSRLSRKTVKKQHHRLKRREAKNISLPNPVYSQYGGWVL